MKAEGIRLRVFSSIGQWDLDILEKSGSHFTRPGRTPWVGMISDSGRVLETRGWKWLGFGASELFGSARGAPYRW